MDLRLSGFCVRGVHVFQEHFQHLSEKYKEFRHSLKAVREDVRIACVWVKDVGGVAGRRAHLSRTYLPLKSICHPGWSTVGGIYSSNSRSIIFMMLLRIPMTTPYPQNFKVELQEWCPVFNFEIGERGYWCWVGRINSAYSRYAGFPLMFEWDCGVLMII